MKKMTFLLFLCIICMGIQAQTTRYASPDGSTDVTGTDPTQPMDLRLAINSTSDGDTLLLEGTFTFADDTEIIFFQGRNNITVGSFGAGATIQRGTTVEASGISFIVLVDCTNMTVENINFTNNFAPNSRAIFMYGSGDNYTIQNNTFSNIGWTTDPTADPVDDITGIASGCNVIIALGNKNPTSSGIVNTNGEITNLNILNNTISDCITGTSESITVAGNVDGFLVEGNSVTDVTNIAIDAAGHFDFITDFETGIVLNDVNPELNQARNGVISGNTVTNAVSLVAVSAGIYCDGCRDVVIKENIVSQSGTGFSIGCEVGGGNTAENVTLINNISRDNLQSGMFMGSISSEGEAELSSVNNCIVRNNVFYNNNTAGITETNNFAMALSKGTNNEISNNIFHLIEDIEGSGNDGVGITVFDVETITSNISNYTITNNLFYKTSGETLTDVDILATNGAAISITNSVLADASFLDTTNNLFEISDTSAAVNAGSAIILVTDETDFDGDVRVQGDIVDIGAQETSVLSTVSVSSVALDLETATLEVGATQQLTATVNPTDATDQTVTWISGDDAIASVDANGLVTAVANGETTITVTTTDGAFTATALITVTTAVTGITIDPTTLTLVIGDTSQITATISPADATDQTIIWSTDGDTVATVDENGLVTAISNGSALISASTTDGSFFVTALVIVEDPVTIFDDCNSSDSGVSLAVGNYTEDDLEDLDLEKEDILAIKIADGYRLIGFKDKNFKKDAIVITTDTCLDNTDFEDKIKSIIVEEIPTTVATVYDHCSLEGWSVELGVGTFTEDYLIALGADKEDISYIQVADGYRVIGFEKEDFEGDAVVITADTCLSTINFANEIRSIIIEEIPPTVATVYDHCSLQGWSVELGVGSYTEDILIVLGADKEDISYVQVADGYRLIGYEKEDFDGFSVEITADTCLSDINFANEIRSVVVEEITANESKTTQDEKVVANEFLKLTAYPNPAKSIINISGIEEGQLIQVFNIIGSKMIETKESTINVSNLPSGMYFIKSEEQSIKFIKQE